MKKLENFVKHTFKNADKENREEIIRRAIESLSEKVEDLIETGLTENEAIDKLRKSETQAQNLVTSCPFVKKTSLQKTFL